MQKKIKKIKTKKEKKRTTYRRVHKVAHTGNKYASKQLLDHQRQAAGEGCKPMGYSANIVQPDSE